MQFQNGANLGPISKAIFRFKDWKLKKFEIEFIFEHKTALEIGKSIEKQLKIDDLSIEMA